MRSPPTSDSDDSQSYTCISVTEEFRDMLRVRKAENGQSYEEFLQEHISLDTEQ